MPAPRIAPGRYRLHRNPLGVALTRPISTQTNSAPTELGRYRLVRHIASGGMGEVYLAEAGGAAGFAKRVVVKVLRPELATDTQLVAQLIAEGRLLEALDHPNIAQILDIGQQDEFFWLAMEHVDGADLRALLRALPAVGAPGRLGSAATLHVLLSVARALEHAQTRKGPDGRTLAIVHHDVSPSNVMVRRDGHVKLVDFGVARAAVLGKLPAGALRGKLPYLSPEQAQQRSVDGRADLFALGLLGYELLTGERAVDITEPSQIERAHKKLPERVAVLKQRGVASGLCDLILAMTQLDPNKRPKDAAEVVVTGEQLFVAMQHGAPARTLAAELEPAFARIEAQTGSFDATLAGILGLADGILPSDRTGTLSLPGLDVVAVAAASARDEGGATRRRWRKRWITLGLLVVIGAIAMGFWIGRRGGPPTDVPVLVVETPKNPVATPADADTHAAGVGAGVADGAVARAEPDAQTATAQDPTPTEVAAQESGPANRPRPSAVKQDRSATLRLRVQPVSCQVTVDGEVRRPLVGTDRYEMHVGPGDHLVRVQDKTSGQRREIAVKGLRDGEERTLPGVCLGEGCPSGGE